MGGEGTEVEEGAEEGLVQVSELFRMDGRGWEVAEGAVECWLRGLLY